MHARTPSRPRSTLIAALTAAVVAALVSPAATAEAATERPARPAPATTNVDDGSQTDEERALAQAQATGQQVEVISRRTEVTDYWADPDGNFVEKRHASPVRILRDGDWIDVDPTLTFAADGRVAPKATSTFMTFSGGGTGPMVSMVKDGRTLTLAWPSALPRPALAGTVATYPNVLPGVDLQLKADLEGFSQLLVVKTREAASNPALATLQFGLDTAGLTLDADADGNLSALNPAGQVVFTSPPPLMWDSTVHPDQGGGPARVAPGGPEEKFEPPPGSKDAVMATRVDGDSLEIVPNAALLRAADTKYPVFLDPSWAEGKRQNWTRVYKKYPKNSYWNANEVARVGYENETNGLSQSFFQLDTSNVAGKQVISSTFRIKNVWSWSCTPAPLQLWQTTRITKQTNWLTRPSKVGTMLAQISAAKGWGPNCPAGNLEFNVTNKIREIAAARIPNITLGMYAADESETYQWKKFDPKTAVLETKYQTPPDKPRNLGTHPSVPCGGGGIGNTTVSLYATIVDPDAGNLQAQFQLGPVGKPVTVDQTISALNWRVSTLVVPDRYLPSGTYVWKVRARDRDGLYSPWSQTCKFTVDRDRPSKPPTITSAEFPDGDKGWPNPTGKARTPGSFTLGAGGVAEVVQYTYWTEWDAEPRTGYAPTAGGSYTATLTPPGFGPHYVYAYSMDRAGNRSDTTAYLFYANRAVERDQPGDLNGDGRGDLWTVDSSGNLLTYAGQGDGVFSTATNGGLNLAGASTSFRDDWQQDGYNDLIALEHDPDAGEKKLWIYPNNGSGVADPEHRQEASVTCPRADAEGCAHGNNHWFNAQQVIATGDVNTDTHPDLLVKQGKHLWLYHGTRNEMVLDRPGSPVLVGGNTWDKVTVISPGDTNGDRIPDLWTRDIASGKLYQYLGRKGPDGKLDPTAWGTSPRTEIGSGLTMAGYPTLGSNGDLTADGKPDLWAHTSSNTILAWPGRTPSPGTYAFDKPVTVDGIPGTKIPAGTRLDAGDTVPGAATKLVMQNDGNLVLHSASDTALWSSNTAGNPGAHALMQSDGNLVVRNINGEVLWASGTAAANPYAVLHHRGSLVVYAGTGHSLWSTNTVIRRDHNGDGRSDFAVIYGSGPGEPVRTEFRNFRAKQDGSGGFDPFRQSWTSDGSWRRENATYLAGDYNGDGRADLAAFHTYPDNRVRAWTFTTAENGSFSPRMSWISNPGGWNRTNASYVSGDYNGDGRDDIAAVYRYPDGRVSVWTFTTGVAGTFNKPYVSWTSAASWNGANASYVTGDYNGDGRDDIAAIYTESADYTAIWTFSSGPYGMLTPSKSWTSDRRSWSRTDASYVSGDYNSDRRDDIAALHSGADQRVVLWSFLTEDDGTFRPRSSWESNPNGWTRTNANYASADYNGDGRDDIAALYAYPTGGPTAAKLWTFPSNPDGGFDTPLSSWSVPAGGWDRSRTSFP